MDEWRDGRDRDRGGRGGRRGRDDWRDGSGRWDDRDWRDDRRDDRRNDRRDDRGRDWRDDRWDDRDWRDDRGWRDDRWDDRDRDWRDDRWDGRRDDWRDDRDRRDDRWDDRDEGRGWDDDRRDSRGENHGDDGRDDKHQGPTSVIKHRSEFDLYSIKEDGDPFSVAAALVVEWLVQKESMYGGSPIEQDLGGVRPFPAAWDYAMPSDYAGGDFDRDEWPALACVSRKDEQGRVTSWVAEYDEPDSSHAGRRWHTTVSLTRDAGEGGTACRVGIQSVCRRSGGLGEPLPQTVASPSLVRMMVDLPWYVAKVGATQLQTVPNKLSTQTFEHFSNALTDKGRTLPLVLFCTGYSGKIPEQAKQLARRALGTVNVYVVDWSNQDLRDQVEKLFERGTAANQYACPRGSARMYLPGIDLTDPNRSRTHQSWDHAALEAQRPSQFAESLARRFVPDTPTRSISDLIAGSNGDADRPAPSPDGADGPAQEAVPGEGE